MTLPVLRRGAQRLLMRGGGGGPAPPPFMHLPAIKGRVHKDQDLLWNDPIAPEITTDFDATNFSNTKALGLLSTALGTLGLLYLFVDKVLDPPSQRPSVKRVFPFDNLSRELGKKPAEE